VKVAAGVAARGFTGIMNPEMTEVPDELTLRADASEMPRASEWLEALCQRHAIPGEHVGRLLLCLDDALANVIDHGGPAAHSHPIQLQFELSVEPPSRTASVTLSDAGQEFDPVSAADKALPTSLDEASSRGRGLQMIRACSTVFRYRREAGRNHMTFGTSWQ
jgi:anti-sigma regulatory factor (Ser/Thr protein kinase)